MKSKALFFTLLPIFLFSVAASYSEDLNAASLEKAASRDLDHVDALLGANENDQAVSESKKFLQVYSNYYPWKGLFTNRLAISLLRNGDFEEALPLLEDLVRSEPNNSQAHRNLGACLLAMGRRGRALSEYEQVVELDPGNYLARLEFGQVLMDFRIFSDAQRELTAAAYLCPHCLDVLAALAQIYQESGQPALAVEPLEKLWHETGDSIFRRKLLVAYVDSGQDLRILGLFEENFQADFLLDEWIQLVAAEGRIGSIKNSLHFEEKLSIEHPESALHLSLVQSPIFWGLISHNLMVAEESEKSLAAINQAIKFAPENVVYRNNKVVLLHRLGRHQEADQEWEIVVQLDPARKRTD
ncbi:MAG: tetratricopeptide repeat protein [bacterium]|nr:tetratricopeptide repeat protein [bacterium]